MHESSLYKENAFLTLTYDRSPDGDTLVPEHNVLFMKRLRKHVKRKIRFYHCGEYGDTTLRPHYHSIVFNLDFEDKKFHKTTESGSKLYISPTLDKIWGHGHTYVGDVTFESAAYCARYVMKKLTGARKSEYGDRVPEYSTMSRGGTGGLGGIGAPWLRKWKRDVFPNDFCVINGRRVRVPKAYDQLMIKAESPIGEWVEDETGFPVWMPSIRKTAMESTKAKRIRSAAKHSENQTRERLDVIEELTELRVKRLTRSI